MSYQNELPTPDRAGPTNSADFTNLQRTSETGAADSRFGYMSSDKANEQDDTTSSLNIGLLSGNNEETLRTIQRINGRSTREMPTPDEQKEPPPAEVPMKEIPMPAIPGYDYAPPTIKPTSEVPIVHRKLQEANIDPTKTNGIKLGIIEENYRVPNDHGSKVISVINGPEHGMIPGFSPNMIYRKPLQQPEMSDYSGKPDGLNQYIIDHSVSQMDQTTSQIKNEVAKKDPALRVINMSFGVNNNKEAQYAHEEMWKDPYGNREIITELLGKEKADLFVAYAERERENPALTAELMNAVIKRVDSVVENSPKVSESKEKYRAATQEAAEHGITVCVSAGNSENAFSDMKGVQPKPGNGFNWYAQSDNVISAGATDTKATPGDKTDDKMMVYSSSGTDRYHPTVSTQGYALNTNPLHYPGGVHGTSVASPQVAGTVTLMLAQNPKMTFEQIKTTLQKNTVQIANTPVEAQGAGILLPEQAIIAARNSR